MTPRPLTPDEIRAHLALNQLDRKWLDQLTELIKKQHAEIDARDRQLRLQCPHEGDNGFMFQTCKICGEHLG